MNLVSKLQYVNIEDTLISLIIKQQEEDYNTILHDMGSSPFFLLCHSGEQTYLYRNYCLQNRFPKLIIYATGGVESTLKNLEF